MMRVLVDTDVILDHLVPRPPFWDEAKAIWFANAHERFEGYISAVTPVNVFYIARKEKGIAHAQQIVADLLASWRVCPVHDGVLKTALSLAWPDFEDAVQHASATQQGLDTLLTRNLSDYRQASLTVLSPTEFLARLAPPAP